MAMDDRKSAVSSFYGNRERKSSFDALQSINNPPRDDASSFYNPRTSADLLTGQPSGASAGARGTAGYNRNSFFFAGREEPLKGGRDEEESMMSGGAGSLPGGARHSQYQQQQQPMHQDEPDDGWDVYADFNNAGPKYSSAFAGDGYQPISTPQSRKDDASSVNASSSGPVEMVTVPAFGAEWGKKELRDMTKSGRKARKSDERMEKWKAFHRGERGLCGIKWLKKKYIVFVVFGLCVAVGLVLAFTIPRVPSFGFNAKTPLTAASGTDFGSSIQTNFQNGVTFANFSFAAFAQLQLNTQDNFLPLTFKHLRAEVFDTDTNMKVAEGDLGHYTVPAKAFPEIKLPLNFTYVASNNTDQTFKDYFSACKNKGQYTDGVRPGLKIRLALAMDILGLPGTPKTSAEINNANCPIELANNAG